MITAVGLLLYLEARIEAVVEAGEEEVAAQLDETARFVRLIAEAALVAGDAVTLQEARRVAARLHSFGLAPMVQAVAFFQEGRDATSRRTCPRCGQTFDGPSGPIERVGSLLCGDCARELVAGIRV